MRALILAFVLGLALATSAQAVPLAPMLLNPVTYIPNQEWVPLLDEPSRLAPVDVTPPIELVRVGCGHGWHRHHWRDQWGNWQWGDCVPNEGGYGYDGRGAGWYNPHPDWRGLLPRWGWGYP